MLALVKTAAGPGLSLESVPEPVPGINDVLIRVRKTGICGTDLHIEAWDAVGREDDHAAARSSGHEFVGEVVEVGSQRLRLPPGRRRQRRGPRDLRAVPPLPRRAPPPVRPHRRAWAWTATARSPSTSCCR